MRGYRELLREYGLIPVASNVSGSSALGASLCTMSTAVHQIVEVTGYAGWDEVVARTQEFIRAFCSWERIEGILASNPPTRILTANPPPKS
jgi:hypothetical protein